MNKYPHPANGAILAFLSAHAVPRNESNASPWDIDEFELHTHPDLCERLLEVAGPMAGHCKGAAYGYPVMVTEGGVIFSVACGTGLLAFRLPEEEQAMALEMGGTPRSDFGKDWIVFDPWNSKIRWTQLTGDLRFWCEQAFRYALELSSQS